jgi:hypothetical protein
MFAIAARYNDQSEYQGLEVAEVAFGTKTAKRLLRRRTGNFVWNTREEAEEAMARVNVDDCHCSSDGMRYRTFVAPA